MPAELPAYLTLASVLLGLWFLRSELSALRSSTLKLQESYKDALTAISARADREAAIAKQTLEVLASYEKSVGDKRGLESTVTAERAQNEFLRERVTELQRSLMAFTDRRVEATVVGQTNRDKTPETEPVLPISRWAAASGTTTFAGWPVAQSYGKPKPVPVPDPTEAL